MAAIPVAGACDPRFAALREAFAENFAGRDEVGAGVCVMAKGCAVVDLWGGFRDEARTRPWSRDTLVNAYSVGKGVAAMLVLRFVEGRRIDLDVPVQRYWPEFAAEGKRETTLRMLLSHRAGLPAVREPLPEHAQYHWSAMTGALAAQAPFWEPGTAHGYHCNTFGFLVGELVRRVHGSSFGTALRELVTGPLQADYFVGLPRAEHGRVADIVGPGAEPLPPGATRRFPEPTGDPECDLMRRHAYFNPSGLSGFGVVNSAAWRLAEIPSTNGHGTARAVAALYASLLEGAASPLGVGAGLLCEATRVHSDGDDLVLGRSSRFGLGFQLGSESRAVGGGARSFGHFGYGGSLGFADPDAGLAFGYVMNRPGERWHNPRTDALVDALYGSL
jgi:CubicO group peptidase (beta-lactamase class C family)